MDIINRATTVSAPVRALLELAAAARGWWHTFVSAPVQDLAMPARDLAYAGRGIAPCAISKTTTMSCVGDLRAQDHKFSTRLGPSASPPV